MSVAIFRNYDQAALDRQYDNGLKVGEEWLKGQRARWVEQSARARDTLPCTFDVPYDAGSGERLDIFRPKQAVAFRRCRSTFMAATGSATTRKIAPMSRSGSPAQGSSTSSSTTR